MDKLELIKIRTIHNVFLYRLGCQNYLDKGGFVERLVAVVSDVVIVEVLEAVVEAEVRVTVVVVAVGGAVAWY